MGNFSEFRRVVDVLVQKSNFDSDINVSVFETNIRIVGGLLGAHLMQHRSGAVEPGWPCNGPLLRMAEDVVRSSKIDIHSLLVFCYVLKLNANRRRFFIIFFASMSLAGQTFITGIRYQNGYALRNGQFEAWSANK